MAAHESHLGKLWNKNISVIRNSITRARVGGALVTRPKNAPLAPLPWEGAVFEPASWLPPSTESASTSILDFPASPTEASVVDKLPGAVVVSYSSPRR